MNWLADGLAITRWQPGWRLYWRADVEVRLFLVHAVHEFVTDISLKTYEFNHTKRFHIDYIVLTPCNAHIALGVALGIKIKFTKLQLRHRNIDVNPNYYNAPKHLT